MLAGKLWRLVFGVWSAKEGESQWKETADFKAKVSERGCAAALPSSGRLYQNWARASGNANHNLTRHPVDVLSPCVRLDQRGKEV